jgi:copper(I)-binding protein
MNVRLSLPGAAVFSAIFAAIFLLSTALHARDALARELSIEHAYARSTVPGQTNGAAYLTIENKGKHADKLIAAASTACESVQIHTMSMAGNVMKMREVQDIELKPHAKIAMNPGDGYHIMLIGLKQPLKRGEKFPLTLSFEKAGKVEVPVTVDDTAAAK